MKKIKLFLAFIAGAMCFLLADIFFHPVPKDPYVGEMTEEEIVNSAPCIQMYFYIKKYSKKYGVPEAYAFSVAYQETNYQGPLDFNYDYDVSSTAGAVGPMQIIPRYAHYFVGRRVTGEELKTNIKLNVETSMKMLKYWHDKYGDWTLAAGAYNTGSPVINGYAIAVKNKEYYWKKM